MGIGKELKDGKWGNGGWRIRGSAGMGGWGIETFKPIPLIYGRSIGEGVKSKPCNGT